MSELYGAPRSLLPIIDVLNKNFDINVITFGDRGIPQELDKKNIQYTIIPLVKYDRKKLISRIKRKFQNYFGDYYFTSILKRVLKEDNPDLVYVNTVSRGAPIIAANKLKIPVFIHVRESILYFDRKKLIDRRRIKAIVNIPEVYFTVSECTSDLVINQGVNPSKVHSIYNGIDTSVFFPDAKKQKDNVFGFIGNMNARKGIRDYIEISKNVLKNDMNKLSYVVGGNLKCETARDILNNQIPRNLRSNFIFTGKVSNVVDYFQTISVFCMTSKEEPFGRVLVEAMATKLPIVAFDNGAIKELIDDGENGYIIPKGNMVLFQKKLEQLLSDKKLREKMGSKGQEIALNKFKESDYIDRIEKIMIPEFMKLLNKKDSHIGKK